VNEIIITRREQVIELCRKHHVRRLSVFGSVLRDDFNPDSSDIDFVVEFKPTASLGLRGDYFDLLEELTRLFSRKVDLVSWEGVRNPYFRRSVERSQELLYAA
jgi:predicted nucleotidyltransferase